MNRALNKVIKSHIILSVLSVFAVALLMTGVSYALFVKEHTNTKNQQITVGNLDIDLTSTSGSIVLNDLYPQKFTEISADDNKYTFTISNTGDYKITYLVYLTDNTTTFLNENPEYSNYTKMNKSSFKNIDYRVDSSFVINSLGQVYNESNGRMTVLQGSLEPGDSEEHYIQFWLDAGDTTANGASNDVIGNILALNINMEAVADENGTIAFNKISDLHTGLGGIKETGIFNQQGVSPDEIYVTCSNGTASWSTYPRGLKIESLNNVKTLCDITYDSSWESFDPIWRDVMSDPNIVHETFTDSSGKTIDAGYRYEGPDPNNYVIFNNELWRIIGLFEVTLANGMKDKLVKIIRDEPIGNFTYSTGTSNAWLNTSGQKGRLNALLNNYYYNSLDASNTSYCYGSGDVKKNCDWTESGIREEYRSMIENVVWDLGGINISSSSATNYFKKPTYDYYLAEKSSTVYSSNQATATGYVGLMYPSDYGFAVLASSCKRTTTLNNYGKTACAGNNWLYKYGNEWTMSVASNDKKTKIYIQHRGLLWYTSSTTAHATGYAVRPTVYLKKYTIATSGDGSIESPYLINFT